MTPTTPAVTLVLPGQDAVGCTPWEAVLALLPYLNARQLGRLRESIHAWQLIAQGVRVTPFKGENGHAPTT